jgi:hypothetical protein
VFVVNAGAEDDIGKGLGDMRNESLADIVRIGIEEFLNVFASLSAPVTRSDLSLCTKKKGTLDIRVLGRPNSQVTHRPTRRSCKLLRRTEEPGPAGSAKWR